MRGGVKVASRVRKWLETLPGIVSRRRISLRTPGAGTSHDRSQAGKSRPRRGEGVGLVIRFHTRV